MKLQTERQKEFALGTIQTLTFAITQLVIALHWLCRGEGSNPGKPEFFSGNTVSFHNRASYVFNRNDRLCIYISDCYQGHILGGPTTSQQSFPNLPRLTPSQHTPITRCLLMNFTCMKKSAAISYNLHVGDRHIIEFISLEQNIIEPFIRGKIRRVLHKTHLK